MIPLYFRYQGNIESRFLTLAVTCVLFLASLGANAQTTNETMGSGSYIINMGQTPRTVSNALRPYGVVHNLLKNYQVPIPWVINPTKPKDVTDFTHNYDATGVWAGTYNLSINLVCP